MVLITPSDKKESLSRQSDDASAVGSLFRRVRTRRIQDNRRRKKRSQSVRSNYASLKEEEEIRIQTAFVL